MVTGYQLAPNAGAEALQLVGSLQAIRPTEYAFNVLGLGCAVSMLNSIGGVMPSSALNRLP